jgi:hypothetical protein
VGNFSNCFSLTVGCYANVFGTLINLGSLNGDADIGISQLEKSVDSQIAQNLEQLATDMFNSILEKELEHADTGSLASSLSLENLGSEFIISLGSDSIINPKNNTATSVYAEFAESGHFSGKTWVMGNNAISDTLAEFSSRMDDVVLNVKI